MNILINRNNYSVKMIVTLFLALILFAGCSKDNDPKKEDVPELITRVTLTFTPVGGGDAVVVTAVDPDGEGIQDLTTSGAIELEADKTYALAVELLNEIAQPGEEGYDITEEVEEEGDEHMFFYSCTNDLFSDPAGNGNIDDRADAMNYTDEDENGLPIGLHTTWTTGSAETG